MPEAVDPVCGMKVDTAKTPYKHVYKGKIYYFCSEHCLRAFKEKPDYYLEHGPVGMPHEH
ncbi:MAG: YHS domain-containing protein [Desulfurococcales archaeon]|nr:YHS domain-containing protein [Desulfurococcales archaeon]